jgi:hypothetical protein
MDALYQLIIAIGNVAFSLWELVVALFVVVLPWAPLGAWIAFWMFAVNWSKLRESLARGGWVGVALIGAIAVLIWGVVAPGDGTFNFFGLKISNFVEKTVYVSGLVCIMFLAGAMQLAGCCASCCQFEEPAEPAADHGHGHGH